MSAFLVAKSTLIIFEQAVDYTISFASE